MDVSQTLRELRKTIVLVAKNSREGHIPSSLSVLEILFCYYHLRVDFFKYEKSLFILSKGHASLAYYVVLEKFGYLSRDTLESYCEFDSILGGHPDSLKIKEVSASTGSLGHGLPFAVGVLLADRQKENERPIFVLVGDGELNEGSNWEALLLACNHRLTNLRLILDMNKSSDRALEIINIERKMKAFGLDVTTIDGHDITSIMEWMKSSNSEQPRVLVANTIKGNGFKVLENNPAWHHTIPTEEQLTEILASES
jgi:transketolase